MHGIIIFIFLSYWRKGIAEFVLLCILKCFELHCIDGKHQFKWFRFFGFSHVFTQGNNAKCIATHPIIFLFFSVIGRKGQLNLYYYAFSNVLKYIAVMENLNLGSQDFWILSCVYTGKKCEIQRYASYHYLNFSQLLAERDC